MCDYLLVELLSIVNEEPFQIGTQCLDLTGKQGLYSVICHTYDLLIFIISLFRNIMVSVFPK